MPLNEMIPLNLKSSSQNYSSLNNQKKNEEIKNDKLNLVLNKPNLSNNKPNLSNNKLNSISDKLNFQTKFNYDKI